jgi:hypothetical protein
MGGVTYPWGELSMGRVEFSIGRNVMGRVSMKQVVCGVSFDGASCPGTDQHIARFIAYTLLLDLTGNAALQGGTFPILL